jgi:hypothetical protein
LSKYARRLSTQDYMFAGAELWEALDLMHEGFWDAYIHAADLADAAEYSQVRLGDVIINPDDDGYLRPFLRVAIEKGKVSEKLAALAPFHFAAGNKYIYPIERDMSRVEAHPAFVEK